MMCALISDWVWTGARSSTRGWAASLRVWTHPGADPGVWWKPATRGECVSYERINKRLLYLCIELRCLKEHSDWAEPDRQARKCSDHMIFVHVDWKLNQIQESLKVLITEGVFSSFNTALVFSTVAECATSLGESIRVLKWNMTDNIVLYVITRLHLAKWVNLSSLLCTKQAKPSSRQFCASCSFNMNWVMFQSNKSRLVQNNPVLQTGPWVMDWKSLYLITPAAQGWLRSIWEAVRWNSNMDTLQLLTLSLSGRCAFSVLTLVVPHLLPPGSFAILFDGRHWLPFPHSALLMHQRMWIA